MDVFSYCPSTDITQAGKLTHLRVIAVLTAVCCCTHTKLHQVACHLWSLVSLAWPTQVQALDLGSCSPHCTQRIHVRLCHSSTFLEGEEIQHTQRKLVCVGVPKLCGLNLLMRTHTPKTASLRDHLVKGWGVGRLKTLLLKTNHTTMLWVQFSLLAKNSWKHKNSSNKMLGGRSIHSSVHHHNVVVL
jgi:hypothetical protein